MVKSVLLGTTAQRDPFSTTRLTRLTCELRILTSRKNYVLNDVDSLYSWSSWKPDGADELGFDFMPMLWGESDVSDFEANVKPGYGTHILGFNEYVYITLQIITADT